MSEQTVLLTTANAVATITLNRPKQANAFNAAMRAELLDAVTKANADSSVRVVVIKAAGSVFCAGADLAEPPVVPISKQIKGEYKPILSAIADSEKLYIAQVRGSAAGIGAALAMTCDFATMGASANIYMAFAAIALVPDGGASWLLEQALGPRRALEMIVEAQRLKADECLANGLANKVFADDDLDKETLAWAHSLSQRAPLAMAQAKALVRNANQMTRDAAISAEAAAQDKLTISNDFRRGVQAFMAREKPVFEGN